MQENDNSEESYPLFELAINCKFALTEKGYVTAGIIDEDSFGAKQNNYKSRIHNVKDGNAANFECLRVILQIWEISNDSGSFNGFLAELNTTTEIANTCNWRKARSKTLPAVAAMLRKNMESLNEADGRLYQDTLPGDISVFSVFLFFQQIAIECL